MRDEFNRLIISGNVEEAIKMLQKNTAMLAKLKRMKRARMMNDISFLELEEVIESIVEQAITMADQQWGPE